MNITRNPNGIIITKAILNRHSGGIWAKGLIREYMFSALVFAEHALNPDWELGRSKISKLELKKVSDGKTVFAWDRGLNIDTEDSNAQRALNDLTAVLAQELYPTIIE